METTIKHIIEKEYLKIFYSDNKPPYSISIYELGDAICWRIGAQENKILIDNVSKWAMSLLTDKDLSKDFAYDFIEIIKTYVPVNKIDWGATKRAINIYDEYRQMRTEIEQISINGFSRIPSDYAEKTSKIIDKLKLKYDL
ncbi:MAG: hypothetical protein JXR36_04685 [Bacteroidales bacterium]|nr:hypothetical protein [Bacteroidales bacterium]